MKTIFLYLVFFQITIFAQLKHYYCVPADEKHFHLLKNLIGSIHCYDQQNLGEIAVYDLGFSLTQVNELRRMKYVTVNSVEMTHPNLLKPLKTCSSGRMVRGYFAWKPVVIKQALEKFPYILYVDAGTTITKPLDHLFEYIYKEGFFILSCTENEFCNLSNRLTKTVVEKFLKLRTPDEQKMILSGTTYNIDAGLQGLSRKMLDSYVLPMYEHSKDLDLFKDDGTAKLGYGAGRHDQTLFSMYVYFLNLKRYPEGSFNLEIDGKSHPVNIHWSADSINSESIIYRSRHDLSFRGGMTRFIQYED